MDNQDTETLQPGTGRSENIVFKYAHGVNFFPSPWDLKLVFTDSDFDTATNQTVTKPHTGITLSWEQAKTALLFLRVNIEVHERERGEIRIPKAAFTPAVQEKLPENFVTMEQALKAIDQFIEENAPKKGPEESTEQEEPSAGSPRKVGRRIFLPEDDNPKNNS